MASLDSFDDGELRKFVARGYTHVSSGLPDSYHQQVHDELVELTSRGGDLENGILWRVPDLHQVFDAPAVRAALISILGPGYVMNPHTYCHLSPPGSAGHAWHKDSYILDHNIRHARPRWVMAFYSPQCLTEELGPTTVIPGWQYHEDLDGFADQAEGLELAVPAGTVTLLHADMWHGASPNRADQGRFALKFLFERRQEPARSPLRSAPAAWQRDEEDQLPLLSMDVWRWLHGEEVPAAELEDGGQAEVLLRAIESPSERSRLRAAYALARFGARVVPSLAAALRRAAAAAAEVVGTRGPADTKGINPTALAPAQALAAMSGPAASALIDLAGDPHWYVRMVASDALGNIGPAAAGAVGAMAQLARDSHWWVRRNAIEALGRIGVASGPSGEALLGGLVDPDWRVRLNAAVALGKLAEPLASAVDPLRLAQERDENRYVRYYARVALAHAGPDGLEDDPTPVRSGWSAMRSVAA